MLLIPILFHLIGMMILPMMHDEIYFPIRGGGLIQKKTNPKLYYFSVTVHVILQLLMWWAFIHQMLK